MNLFEEFKSILIDDAAGRWTLLRHFTQVKSVYWNEQTKEAVGGPAYEYVDSVILTYSTCGTTNIIGQQEGEKSLPFGTYVQTGLKFYMFPEVVFSEQDDIYELDWELADKPTVDYGIKTPDYVGKVAAISKRYKIVKKDSYRDINGKIVYNIAQTDVGINK